MNEYSDRAREPKMHPEENLVSNTMKTICESESSSFASMSIPTQRKNTLFGISLALLFSFDFLAQVMLFLS